MYGDIFKKDNFLGIDGYPNSFVYNHILLGKCCKNKTLVEIGASLDFEEILEFDIRRFIKEKLTITRQGDEVNTWDHEQNDITEISFFLSYQDPNRVCLTSKVQYQQGMILKRDLLKMDAEKCTMSFPQIG
jgi:hypothetical protein